jgi:FkbH-like protein
MVRINCPGSLNSYLLKVRFKRWGMLWTPGSMRLYSFERAKTLEQRDYRIGTALYQLPVPASLKRTITNKRYVFKKRMAQRSPRRGDLATSFMLECYNPHDHVVRLSVTIRSVSTEHKVPFQRLVQLTPGFCRVRIAVEEISSAVDLRSPFSVEMIPNDDQDGTTLYFGVMDFLQEVPAAKENSKKVKCVVWDLDNTLWDGILIEDGPGELCLKPGIVDVIKELDRRGILHSIASKNNREEALQVLRDFHIDEYFLYPQISWDPKSEGIKAIARRLNIGIDTLLFMDDSEFELQQVKAICPEVRVLKAGQYQKLPEMKDCMAPATAQAATRRGMYQVEAKRQEIAQGFGQDYLAFLKHCDIRLNIRSLTEENFDRVHELTQRTNQMNFSGNRYDREVLKRIHSTPHLDTYVLDCEDRFGSYGVVGFCIVDRREPRMTDLMFTCRIHSKRVEHAFLTFLIRKYIIESGKDFLANYRKTERNAPSGRVFADLGLREIEVRDGVSFLVFPRDQALPQDGIVRISVQEDALQVR